MLYVRRFLNSANAILIAFTLVACTGGEPQFAEISSLVGPTFKSANANLTINLPNDSVTIQGECPAYLTDLRLSFDNGTTWLNPAALVTGASDLNYADGTFKLILDDISAHFAFTTDGEQHTVLVRGVTKQGEIETAASVVITYDILDTTPPTITGPVLSQASPTNATSITISGTCTDDNSGFDAGSIKLCAKLNGSCSYPADYGITTGCTAGAYSKTIPVTSGTYEFGVAGVDVLLNASSPQTTSGFVVDRDAPAITNVTSSLPAGAYSIGTSVVVNVTFSEAVYVTNSPRLLMSSGGYANYDSGGGTNVLTFHYTVGGGESSADLDVTADVDLNSTGAVADAAGNSAILFMPAVTMAATSAIVIDTTAPTLTGSISDGTIYYATTAASPNLSWSAATDSGSGVDHYEIALGTTPGATDVLPWTAFAPSTGFSFSGLNLNDGQTYYPVLRALDGAGNTSGSITGDGWTVDVTPPDVSNLVINDGTDTFDTAQTPALAWSAATDATSGVAKYEISIGSTSAASDILPLTDLGLTLVAQPAGLTLARGSRYYVNVRATDAAGNVSGLASGDGFVVNSELWTTNFNVTTTLKVGSKIYLGGSFTEVGPFIGGGVPLNAITSSLSWPNGNKARVAGTVYAAVPDGSGGVFIGGAFNSVGGVIRGNLAHILANGEVDPNFRADTDASVLSLSLSGGTLYLGGSFITVGAQSRQRLAAVSAVDGTVQPFNASADADVYALANDGFRLYAGGAFSTMSGLPRDHFAAIDLGTGVVTSSVMNAFNDDVNALAVDGNSLFVGGAFTVADSSTHNRLVAIDLTTGAVRAGFNVDVSGPVQALAVSGAKIFAGGNFTAANFVARPYLAAFYTADGSLSSFSASLNGPILALAVEGTRLHIGGAFTSAGGQLRQRLAAFDITGGNLTGANAILNNPVFALAYPGNTNVYVGGAFTSVNGLWVTRNRLAAFDTATGQVIASFNPNVSGGSLGVRAMALQNNKLYIAGDFTTLAGVTGYNRLAAVDPSTGAADPTFMPNISGGYVSDFALTPTQVVFGGTFTTVNGSSRQRIAAVDYNGSLSVFNPNANSTVNAIKLNGSTVLVGGNFSTIGGAARTALAEVSLATGLATAFDARFNGTVQTIAKCGSNFYVGGSFNLVNGISNVRAGIAAFDGGLNMTSFAPKSNSTVTAVACDSSNLYFSGMFSLVDGEARYHAAAASLATGVLDPSFKPALSTNAFIYSFSISDDAAFATGGNGIGNGPAYFAPLRKTDGTYLP